MLVKITGVNLHTDISLVLIYFLIKQSNSHEVGVSVKLLTLQPPKYKLYQQPFCFYRGQESKLWPPVFKNEAEQIAAVPQVSTRGTLTVSWYPLDLMLTSQTSQQILTCLQSDTKTLLLLTVLYSWAFSVGIIQLSHLASWFISGTC